MVRRRNQPVRAGPARCRGAADPGFARPVSLRVHDGAPRIPPCRSRHGRSEDLEGPTLGRAPHGAARSVHPANSEKHQDPDGGDEGEHHEGPKKHRAVPLVGPHHARRPRGGVPSAASSVVVPICARFTADLVSSESALSAGCNAGRVSARAPAAPSRSLSGGPDGALPSPSGQRSPGRESASVAAERRSSR